MVCGLSSTLLAAPVVWPGVGVAMSRDVVEDGDRVAEGSEKGGGATS